MATGRGNLADFWVPHEIDSWNFQHMLDLWFSEASQNLSSFRKLLFSLFHGGDHRENSKSLPRLTIVFLMFSLWSPLWNNENKSCLNELKFWEASENHKSSICWKFQLSISCGTQKSAKMPQTRAKMNWSFLNWQWPCHSYPIVVF